MTQAEQDEPSGPSRAGSGASVPPAVELLWRRAGTGRRGGPDRPGLSLDRIVAAAVQLADEEGLSAVSMARVAERLGFTTMSLYRHVGSKADLLTLMGDEAGGDPPVLPDAGWRQRLEAWAVAYRGLLRQHPWVLRVPIGGPPVGPRGLAWMDRGLAALDGTRLSEGEKVQAVMLVTVFVLGQARLEDDMSGGAEGSPGAFGGGVDPAAFGDLLVSLLDPVTYPALSRAAAAGAFTAGDAQDEDFRYGLEQVLDGIATRVAD